MENKHEADLFSYLVMGVSNSVRLMGKDQTIKALKQYIETSNPNGFTRSEGTRESILKVPNTEVSKVMGMPIEAFVVQFVNLNDKSLTKESNLNVDTNDVVVSIITALSETIRKLSQMNPEITEQQIYNHIFNSINRLANHDYGCITRDNNQREKVENCLNEMSPSEFYGAIKLYLDCFQYDVANVNELMIAFTDVVMFSTNIQDDVRKSK